MELHNKWTVFIHYHSHSANYGNAYKEIGSFETVEEFWNLYNNIPTVNSIYNNTLYESNAAVIAYSVFRYGIKPEWEDIINSNGAEWGCRQEMTETLFHDLWKNALLGAIGENFDCVGVRAINKSSKTRILHKIEIWMSTTNEDQCKKTLHDFQEINDITIPEFTLMLHTEKYQQAIEFQNKKKR